VSNFRLAFISLIFMGLLSYFLYHTIYGNRGVISKQRVEAEVQKSAEQLEKIRSERIELEHQVKLLRPESLDKDLLEEKARKILGIAKENEEVLINEEEKSKE